MTSLPPPPLPPPLLNDNVPPPPPPPVTFSLVSTVGSAATAPEINFENLEQLGPILKTIVKSGKKDHYVDLLSEYVQKQEDEIERLCNDHYQEFIQSVDQLLKVREETVELKRSMIGLMNDFHDSASRSLDRKKEMIEHRKMFQNMETAVEAIQSCLAVLDLAQKANVLIDSHTYYSALRTLDQLQSTYLRSVAEYDFAKHLNDCIPGMRDTARDAVMGELKEWFVKVRENSRKVGKLAMEQMHIRQQRVQARAESPVSASGSMRIISKSSIHSSTGLELVLNEENDANILENDQVKVDFKPLYQAIHIFDALGKPQELTTHFEEQRRLQANLLLTPNFSLANGDINPFETYLQDVVGFFIIESVVVTSARNFRSRASVDSLWEASVIRITALVQECITQSDDAQLFLSIKILMVVFAHTLEGYSYSVTALMQLLHTLFERYCDLLKLKCSERFYDIVEEDDYRPLTANDSKQLAAVMKAFRLKEDKASASQPFPRQLPFSKMFPACCEIIRGYIANFYQFVEGYTQQHGEMDDILKKSVDNLLIHYVNSALLSRIEASSNLAQVLQVFVNFDYFEQASIEFERLLAEKKTSKATGKVILAATSTFQNSRKLAEKRMFELLKQKITEFLELAEYDFMPPHPSATKMPSAYLRDLVNFLTAILYSTLESLPREIKGMIYFESFDHLANGLYAMVLSPNVRRLNLNFVEDFNADIAFLEKFVNGLHDPNLVDVFLELRQAVNLLRSENMEEFLDSSVRNKKYSRLRKSHVVTLVDKLNNGVGLLAHKADKNKRKQYEVLLKALKGDK
ncbi:Rab GTPase-binding exocyst subunit S15 [Sorochytrium milnesiophthora]